MKGRGKERKREERKERESGNKRRTKFCSSPSWIRLFDSTVDLVDSLMFLTNGTIECTTFPLPPFFPLMSFYSPSLFRSSFVDSIVSLSLCPNVSETEAGVSGSLDLDAIGSFGPN